MITHQRTTISLHAIWPLLAAILAGIALGALLAIANVAYWTIAVALGGTLLAAAVTAQIATAKALRR